ncbi:MAG: hypothetical protein AAFP89_10590 [Bacteroidota bacterium]
MNLELFDSLSEEIVAAKIFRVTSVNMLPTKSQGWNFTWRSLYLKNKSAMFFALSLRASPDQIEGILMLEVHFNEMVYMPNIEISPQNIGSRGRYRNVAGCLLAYASSVSFTHGQGAYHGYLTFTSKTELIELYMNKYGAQLAAGHNMYFNPETGKKLMKKYLDIDYNLNIEES